MDSVSDVSKSGMTISESTSPKWCILSFCLLLSVSVRPGKIGRLRGMDKIKTHPGVFSAFFYHHEGDEIPASGDIRQRVAEFCCLLPDRDSVSHFISMVYETLSIEDEYGNDMIVSKVDTFVDQI